MFIAVATLLTKTHVSGSTPMSLDKAPRAWLNRLKSWPRMNMSGLPSHSLVRASHARWMGSGMLPKDPLANCDTDRYVDY